FTITPSEIAWHNRHRPPAVDGLRIVIRRDGPHAREAIARPLGLILQRLPREGIERYVAQIQCGEARRQGVVLPAVAQDRGMACQKADARLLPRIRIVDLAVVGLDQAE